MQPTEGATLHRQANLSGKADSGGTPAMALTLVEIMAFDLPLDAFGVCQ
jgi:hypothetical protein